MRTDAEAEVRLAAPVTKVVPRFLAGTREVADLVLREPGRSEPLDRLDVQPRDVVLLRQRRPPARDLHLQRRLLVEVEHVQREMSDAERDRLIERCAK